MRSLSLALLLLASPLIAQPVSIGSTSGIDMNFGLAGTTIDMTHPATAAGQVTTAFVRWLGTGCTGALKLKVVRKPATKAKQGINPFTKEPMTIKAKPARNVIKALPLKALKDSV